MAASSKKKNRWSQHVTESSDALSLEPEVFKHGDPAEIARSLKESAEATGVNQTRSVRRCLC